MTRRQVAVCGTLGGYQAHHRRGEPYCQACREAQALHQRLNRQARAYVRPVIPMPEFGRDDLPCRNADPVHWFPEHGGPHTPADQLCGACPLLTQCRDYALKFDLYGVWGGLSRKQRKAIQKREGIEAIPVASTRRREAA